MIKDFKGKKADFKMKVDTDFEQHRLDTIETKEPEMISWIENVIQEDDTFFDIGANIGVFTLYAAAYLKDKALIYSFEPVYHNFSKLCENIYINKLNNVSPFCIAISDSLYTSKIDIASTISGSASHLMHGSPDFFAKDFKKEFSQGVVCISVDDLVEKFKFPCPNHIKIDVDGFESKVIQGLDKTAKNENLRSIFIEITDVDNAVSGITSFFSSRGFNTSHPINRQENHSRFRREEKGTGSIKNILFTR